LETSIEIDLLVYGLYGMICEEIAVSEESVSKYSPPAMKKKRGNEHRNADLLA